VKRGIRIIALVLALGLTGILAATQANASQWTNVCGNGGTGYCINDWNNNTNNGAPIKMYYGGYTNDHFNIITVAACHDGSGAHTTIQSDCLGDWGTNNAFLIGATIVQVFYQNVGDVCLATDGGANVVVGNCANPADGTGGSNGVLMAIRHPTGCTASYKQVLSDRYWDHLTNNGGSIDLQSGGNPGVQAFFQGKSGSTCWGKVDNG